MKQLIAVSAGILSLAALGAGRAEAQWDGYPHPHHAPPTPPPVVEHYPAPNSPPYATDPWLGQVTRGSHQLATQARHMAEMLRAVDGYSHLTDDAERLAGESEHFSRSLHAGVDARHALADFGQVQNAYVRFKGGFDRAWHIHAIPHLRDDYAMFMGAYTQVAHDMEVAARTARRSPRYDRPDAYYPPNARPGYGYYRQPPPRRYVQRRRFTPQVRVRVYPSNPRTTYYDPRTGQYYTR
jgi:hypothetical protein